MGYSKKDGCHGAQAHLLMTRRKRASLRACGASVESIYLTESSIPKRAESSSPSRRRLSRKSMVDSNPAVVS